MDLFQFNDDFIAAVAIGHTDEDVLELFAESIRAGANVLEKKLISTAGPEIIDQVQFVDGAFEIPLDQDQYDAEYGSANEPPKASVRQGIIRSVIQASQEMSKPFRAD